MIQDLNALRVYSIKTRIKTTPEGYLLPERLSLRVYSIKTRIKTVKGFFKAIDAYLTLRVYSIKTRIKTIA